jgi:hypothetical protein
MPEPSDEAVPAGGDQPSGAGPNDASESESVSASAASNADSGPTDDSTDEAEAKRKARLEAAKRRYRATLRNEADSGGGGFSEDYYRSQKPPHWS